MPVARSWVEELIAEYYSLKDYAVSTDVGIGAGKGGGRIDIDIVAVHPQRGDIILIDVRGIWTGDVKSICDRSLKVLKQAEEVMRKKYGRGKIITKQLILIDHIDRHRPKVNQIKQTMQKEGVKVKTLVDVINEIIDYIDRWRERQKKLELVGPGTLPALPDRLYLLKMLEFMKDHEMLMREETVEACALTAILYSTHEEVEELFGREAKRSCRG